MAEQFLSGVKVVEWGEFITAPFCAKMLADGGAEVIKIESPRMGDKSRRYGSFPQDEPHPEKSGLFLCLNTNKLGITLNVREPAGRRMLRKLLKGADIFVENNPPSMMKELALDYASLKDEFPGLIMTSITPWGQTGPYRDYKGYSLNVGAASNMQALEGNPSREPLDHPFSYCDYVGGTGGAIASLAALFAREKTGKGQHCDIASFQAALGYHIGGGMSQRKFIGTKNVRAGPHGSMMQYPSAIFPVRDGEFCIYSIDFNHWKRLMDVLGNPEWSKDERFNPPNPNPASLVPYHYELDILLNRELQKWSKADLFEACRKARTPFIPVMDIVDMVNSPQTKERNHVVEIEHPLAGILKYPGAPAILSETPIKLERPAPLLGQHNEEIYGRRLGYSRLEMLELQRAGII